MPGRQRYWLRALRLLWDSSPAQALGILSATIAVAVIPAATVHLTTVSVDAVAGAVAGGGGGPYVDTAITAGLLLAGLGLAAHLLSVLQQYCATLLQYRMANTTADRIMSKAVRLQLRHFENSETYNTLQLANRESAYRPYQIFNDLTATITSAVALVSVSAVLFTWDAVVATVVLLAPIPSVLATVFYGRITWKVENDRSADRRLGAYLQYLVTTDRTFKETRLFDLGSYFVEQFRALVRGFYQVDRAIERRQSLWTGGFGLLTVGATGFAIYLAITASINAGQVGQFAGYIAAISVVQTSAQGLFIKIGQLYEHNLFLGNLFAFLDLEEDAPRSGSMPFPARLRRGIEFRDVSFTYPGATSPVLDSVSFVLTAGRCTALVGQNGAGKTTLVKLLARLYQPTSGTILVDDLPIDEYDLDELRHNIGIIFQDFVQYEATLQDNIGFGRLAERQDEEKILRAARNAGLMPFLETLPNGLGTQLGRWFQEGRQLSGGQWQKVALGRAFLRDAPIVVLDEPTASIDAAAEAEIFSRLTTIAGRATTMLIAHRFSTVRMADHIIVLERGSLLEEGSHQQLMEADGLYAKLFKLQAAGYLDSAQAH